MSALFAFWAAHWDELVRLVQQHLVLVLVSTGIAIALGVPAGVLAFRRPRIGGPLLFLANIAQTIPSLALFGFLLPLPFIGGIGPRTALVTLTLYALLPVVRTTVGGLRALDTAIVDAGVAMGMTPRQLLLMVQLPLALPSIVAGIRVATVIGVGTATIAAAIGAGGLGEYIFRGLAMVDTTTILAGAVPAAMLALGADGMLAWLERQLKSGRLLRLVASVGSSRRTLRIAIVVAAIFAAALLWFTSTRAPDDRIIVGSKNFTEQVVLGELIAQALERDGMTVTRQLNLGGTFICDRALRAGQIDVYVEYTGTAVTAVFNEDVPRDPAQAFARAKDLYSRAGLTAIDPLGFNNTFAVLVRGADARALGLRTIDDLQRVADRWRPGFGHEFLQRQDGYPGLVAAYGLTFATAPRGMDLSLIYKALADGQIDVIAGDATSALIDTLDLVALDDTRQYFPPYDAIPVVRSAALLRHPRLQHTLASLAGRISAADMRAMNRQVDVDRHAAADVAREFLARH